jgi:hypothetical protein
VFKILVPAFHCICPWKPITIRAVHLQFTCLEKIEASYSFTEDPKYIYAASLSEHKSMLWKQEKVENKKEETSDPEKTYKEKHKSTIIDPVPLPSATCLMKSNPQKNPVPLPFAAAS